MIDEYKQREAFRDLLQSLAMSIGPSSMLSLLGLGNLNQLEDMVTRAGTITSVIEGIVEKERALYPSMFPIVLEFTYREYVYQRSEKIVFPRIEEKQLIYLDGGETVFTIQMVMHRPQEKDALLYVSYDKLKLYPGALGTHWPMGKRLPNPEAPASPQPTSQEPSGGLPELTRGDGNA